MMEEKVGAEKFYFENGYTPYDVSFMLPGGQRLPNGTRYSGTFDPIQMKSEGDFRPEINRVIQEQLKSIQLKAETTTSAGAGTAGQALIPIYVDQRVVDQSRKFTPWTELIPRVSNLGITADFNVITTKAGAVAAVEDASLNDVTDTEARRTVGIKYIYAVGRVTGQLQAAMPSYVAYGFTPQGSGLQGTTFANMNVPNAMQYEIMKRSRALKELEENLIWNGNKTTSGVSGDPNGSEWDGIIALQSTTNRTNLSNAALTWANVETTVKAAFDGGGRPTIAGCPSAVYTDIRKIFIDTFRLRPSDMTGGSAPLGIASRMVIESMVGPITLVPSMFLTNTSGSKQLWFVDTDVVENRVLQDMTFQKMAITNDSEKFFLKEYMATINRAPGFNSFVDAIN